MEEYLSTTYTNKDTTAGPPLTCSQQNAGAYYEDNTEQEMDKREGNSSSPTQSFNDTACYNIYETFRALSLSLSLSLSLGKWLLHPEKEYEFTLIPMQRYLVKNIEPF